MHSRSAEFNALAKRTSFELVRPLDSLLQSLAIKSGWPEDIVFKLNVIVDSDETIRVHYPDDIKQEVEDLENGRPGETPNAAIRPFLLRAPELIQNILEEKALAPLIDLMGVL